MLFLLIFLGAGLINPDSSKTAWIVFPYFFLFLPIGFNLLGTFNLFGQKCRMEKAGYEESIIRLKKSSMAIMILAAVNIILDLIFSILGDIKNSFLIFICINHNINFVIEFSYIAILLLLIASVIAFGVKYDKMFGGVIRNSN